MSKSYDPECLKLAEHFMQDEPTLATWPGAADELASRIQEAVEDFFASKSLQKDIMISGPHH